MNDSRFYWRWWAGLVVWASALALCSAFDLDVARRVTEPTAAFARLVSLAGEWPAWGVLAWCCWILVASRRRKTLARYRPLAMAVIVLALVNPLLLTQSLKLLWGRVRFVDLEPGFSGYTPFYVPAGVGAGESFPSGHVAMAFVTAPIPVWLRANGPSRHAAAAWLAVLAYGLGVAWGRVLHGRHYLTDVVFPIGLSLLLAPLSLRLRVLRG